MLCTVSLVSYCPRSHVAVLSSVKVQQTARQKCLSSTHQASSRGRTACAFCTSSVTAIAEGRRSTFLKPMHAAWTDFDTFIHRRLTLFFRLTEETRRTPTHGELGQRYRKRTKRKGQKMTRSGQRPLFFVLFCFFKSSLLLLSCLYKRLSDFSMGKNKSTQQISTKMRPGSVQFIMNRAPPTAPPEHGIHRPVRHKTGYRFQLNGPEFSVILLISSLCSPLAVITASCGGVMEPPRYAKKNSPQKIPSVTIYIFISSIVINKCNKSI